MTAGVWGEEGAVGRCGTWHIIDSFLRAMGLTKNAMTFAGVQAGCE